MIEFALAASVALAQGSGTASIVEELTKVEQQLATSWKEGDCEAWGAHISPEWSVIHISGAVLTKAMAMEACETPPVPIEDLQSDQLNVRVFGDAAVVTGRTIATAGDAELQTVILRFTDVFVRQDGRWLAVASQATRVAP